MNFNKYPGAKRNSGILQFLINRIPYHVEYYELFLGTGALFYAKKRATVNWLADVNRELIDKHMRANGGMSEDVLFGYFDAIGTLLDPHMRFSKNSFIYLDPPYPADSRRSTRAIYKHEMLDDASHTRLLEACKQCPANIMISTRPNALYDTMLSDWRREEFETVDRAGACTEVVFMNYPPPALLHQYDYLGNDYIDRQRISRKVARFKNKITALPLYEKHALIVQLIKQDRAAVQHFLTMSPGGTAETDYTRSQKM